MNAQPAETTTGLASEWGHWYDRSGAPVYEIRAQAGHLRPVTLRDARKLQLLPGVSSILKLEHQPGLERWKIDQALMAALTLPRIEGESLDAFKTRCSVDMGAQAKAARERGSHLHAALQGYYEGRRVFAADEPFVRPVIDFLHGRCAGVEWKPERSFGCPLGYGGKVDLTCPEVVVDYKFKDFDAIPKKGFGYPEHGMQLEAYAHGLGYPQALKLNIFVSSTVPGLISPVIWDHPDEWEAFLCLLRLWKIRRNYFPEFAP